VSGKGAQALRNWINTRLRLPKQVTIEAHASYEGDSSQRNATQPEPVIASVRCSAWHYRKIWLTF